jgi:uncharacterized protein (TIGR02001 family)
MARRTEAGTLTLGILSAALIAGTTLPAHAQDKKLNLSATATFTTDYVFRGISQTLNNPAGQAELDATYGIFYLGMWGSNLNFGGDPDSGRDLASLEIDYYGGINPTWQGIDFDIGGIYYTYPNAYDPGGNFDYFELKTGGSHKFFDALTLGITNYWSPEFFGETGDADALELTSEYDFANKWWIFSPSVSGLIGWQWTQGADYTYWNAGLTLGFMDHWSADIRYWDTDFSSTGCANFSGFRSTCDARVVGTISASF